MKPVFGTVKKGETMNSETKCLRCGSKNVKPSHVQSTGRIYSRPKDATILGVLKTGAHVNALTCLDCGHVELFVDVKKARSLVKTA
jgi:predicted nucleic-acid-binding Zn-ribbon protein